MDPKKLADEEEELVLTDEIEDPFACFDEWSSPEDDEAFADLQSK